MRKIICLLLMAALLTPVGCATVSTPWHEKLQAFPKIGLGDPKPADGRYVLHLPAGKPVPTKILIEGDIFRGDAVQEVMATPKRDVYFYKEYISFDMKSWNRTRAAIDIGWDVGIPGYENPVPGHIKITVNEKPQP